MNKNLILYLPHACLEIVQQHRTAYHRPQTKMLIKHINYYTYKYNSEYCRISKEKITHDKRPHARKLKCQRIRRKYKFSIEQQVKSNGNVNWFLIVFSQLSRVVTYLWE